MGWGGGFGEFIQRQQQQQQQTPSLPSSETSSDGRSRHTHTRTHETWCAATSRSPSRLLIQTPSGPVALLQSDQIRGTIYVYIYSVRYSVDLSDFVCFCFRPLSSLVAKTTTAGRMIAPHLRLEKFPRLDIFYRLNLLPSRFERFFFLATTTTRPQRFFLHNRAAIDYRPGPRGMCLSISPGPQMSTGQHLFFLSFFLLFSF